VLAFLEKSRRYGQEKKNKFRYICNFRCYATFAVLTGGLAGFHPKKRQPLPGVKKLWEGLLDLNVLGYALCTSLEHKREEAG